MARVTSAAGASGTRASTSPVAGLMTSLHSVACESAHCPLMKCGILVAGGAATVDMEETAFRNREELLREPPCPLWLRAFLPTTDTEGHGGNLLHRLLGRCTLLLGNVRESGFQHVQRLIHLGVGHDQWHEQPDYVAISPRGDRHQAVLVTVL